MSFAEEFRRIRQNSFLTQEVLARELDVSFSSINRWEGGRAMPKMSAMKRIKEFCTTNNIDSSVLEKEWLDQKGANKNG